MKNVDFGISKTINNGSNNNNNEKFSKKKKGKIKSIKVKKTKENNNNNNIINSSIENNENESTKYNNNYITNNTNDKEISLGSSDETLTNENQEDDVLIRENQVSKNNSKSGNNITENVIHDNRETSGSFSSCSDVGDAVIQDFETEANLNGSVGNSNIDEINGDDGDVFTEDNETLKQNHQHFFISTNNEDSRSTAAVAKKKYRTRNSHSISYTPHNNNKNNNNNRTVGISNTTEDLEIGQIRRARTSHSMNQTTTSNSSKHNHDITSSVKRISNTDNGKTSNGHTTKRMRNSQSLTLDTRRLVNRRRLLRRMSHSFIPSCVSIIRRRMSERTFDIASGIDNFHICRAVFCRNPLYHPIGRKIANSHISCLMFFNGKQEKA